MPQQAVTVGDYGHLFSVLASSHTVLQALEQLVTNCIEADATAIRVNFRDESRHATFIIRDNGFGMDAAKLVSVPQSLGSSEKRGKSLTGQHALGLMSAAVRIRALELWIYSRTPSGSETNLLHIWDLQKPKILFELVEKAKWPYSNPLTGQGTVIFIPIVEEGRADIVNVLTKTRIGQSPLARALGEAHREELLGLGPVGQRTQIRIEILGRRRNPAAEFVTPVEYRGAPVSLDPIKVAGFGEIVLDLFCKTPGSAGTIRVRHHTSTLESDLARLDDFKGAPWIHFEGTITATFLDKAAEGIAQNKKSFLLFRSALRKLEPQLVMFYQRIVEEKATAGDIGKLRQALRIILKGPLLFADKVAMPQTAIIASDGELSPDFARADLGRKVAPIGQPGSGREPYAQPVSALSPLPPISKAARRDLATRTIEGLQWRFLANAKGLPYVLNCGVIEINPNHPDYIKFIDPDSHGKRGLTRMMLRLWYMAMITCWVLIDLNFPAEQYDLPFRQMRFGLLFASLSAQLF